MFSLINEPEKQTLLAACDQKYFDEHAPALIYSCVANFNNIHVHVVNPEPYFFGQAAFFRDKARAMDHDATASFSWSLDNVESLTGDPLRTVYACARFKYAADIMGYGIEDVLIVDIDCITHYHIDLKEFAEDIGLFIREPFPGMIEESTIAAGVVYLSGNMGKCFANDLRDSMLNSPEKRAWFFDQRVLYRTAVYWNSYKKHTPILNLNTPGFMDWDFKEGSKIWTGKGDRKYTNKDYISLRDFYMKSFEEVDPFNV